MSQAVRRPGAEAPTTATVLDYACLFTHDLWRKQKRWQDGRLQFHTFNRRIMVYDDRGNLVGDAHRHAGEPLGEGDELELDRGIAIVQVADCTGSREQDLGALLDRRAREVEQRRAAAAAGPPRRPEPAGRPLSALVPSPGPLGRALPALSPFDARRAQARPGEQQPHAAAKRRRVSASPPPSRQGYAQSLFGAKLTLSPCPAPMPTPPAAPKASEKKPGSRTGRSTQGRAGSGDQDDAAIIDAPPPSPDTTAARPARPAIGPAPSRNTSWRPPRVSAHSEAEKGHASRCLSPDEVLQSHLADSSAMSAKKRDKVDDGMGATRPATETQRVASRELGRHDERKGGDQRAMQKRPHDVLTSEMKEGARVSDEKPPRPPGEEQRCASGKAERRTELRIKARPKRGLLMMAEQYNVPKDMATRRSPETAGRRSGGAASASPEPRDAGHRSETCEAATTARSEPESGMPCHVAPGSTDSSSESAVAPAYSRRRRRTAPVSTDCDSEDEAPRLDQSRRGNRGLADEGNDKDSRSRRQCRAEIRQTADTSDDEAHSATDLGTRSGRVSSRPRPDTEQAPERRAAVGPRIARLSRKSIRNREIIGYAPPAEADRVPALFVAAASRTVLGGGGAEPGADEDASAAQERARVARGARGEVGGAMAQERGPEAEQDAGAGPRRVVNPATRGKKAARKEDAAGLVPQTLVPLDPPAAASKDGGGSALPGFSRANGGAWSKHAEELLGMARPAGNPGGG